MGLFDAIGGILGLGDEPSPGVNPSALARKQQQVSQFNVVSPFGGREFGKTPEGRTQVTVTESPFQKSVRGLQEAGLLQFFGSDAEAERRRVESALFERGSALIEPERERQRRELETSLSLKGLPIGSEAFREQTGELSRRQSEELQQLSLASILAGGQEARASREARLGELGADVTGRGFLQSLALNVQSPDVAGIFQQSDALNIQRQAVENQRKQGIFDTIAGGIAAAFLPGK